MITYKTMTKKIPANIIANILLLLCFQNGGCRCNNVVMYKHHTNIVSELG